MFSRTSVRRAFAIALLAAGFAVAPLVAAAQAERVSGLLVRVQGDVVVGDGESADVVLVINGDAEVRGRAAAVMVLGGTARLAGARVGQLVVVRGVAELERGTLVEGDVWLTWARLEQAPGARVEGSVHRGVARFGWGWLAVAPLLSAGLAVLVVCVALLAVTLGADRMRRAAAGLTGDAWGALTWALVLFVAVPAGAALAYFTVVGLPTSLVVLGLLLPVAGLAGFAVMGLRLGTWVLRSRAVRPYGAAALGSALLLAVGLVPVAGQVLVVVAAALGAGALARTFGRQGGAAAAAPTAEDPGGPEGLPD